VEHNDGGRRRRVWLFAAAAGLAVAVALTAGAVIAFGSSASTSSAAPPSSTPTPGPTLTSGAGHSPSPTPSPASSAGAIPAASRPSGQVKDGVHAGDLRFFLLPVPPGADDEGDTYGSVLTADDLAVASADQAATRAALTADGFQAGAYRTYLTADGAREVTVRLARFAGPDQAAAYYASLSYQGTSLALGTDHPSRAYHLASGSAESSDSDLAVSYQGDVQITVTVTGGQDTSGALLRDLLNTQYQRLATGH